jgi:hypothetical protein
MTDSTELVVKEAFAQGSTMQRLLGAVYEELGGLEFVVGWAEDNPSDFMRMLMAANPPLSQHGPGGVPAMNLHIHPGLAPGPLDAHGVTIDADT